MESNYSKNSAKKRTPRKSLLVGKLIVIAVFVIAMTIIVVKTYNDTVLVRIGSQVITEEQLDVEYGQLPEYFASRVNRSEFLQTEMIPNALLAEASKDVPDKVIDEHLEMYGDRFNHDQNMTNESIRELLRIEIFLNEALYSQIEVTGEEISKLFESKPNFALDGQGNVIPQDQIREEVRRSIENKKLDRALQEYVLSLYDVYAPEFKPDSLVIDHKYQSQPIYAPWDPNVVDDCFSFTEGILEACAVS